MENYALFLLENALRDELIARETAAQATAGSGFIMRNDTMAAFTQSRRLAEQRIPQLQSEIVAIKNVQKPSKPATEEGK